MPTKSAGYTIQILLGHHNRQQIDLCNGAARDYPCKCNRYIGSGPGREMTSAKSGMKKIEAIIRSSKFEEVKEALESIGTSFFTFMEVKGYGKQKGEHVVYRGAAYDVGYIGRIQLEIIVADEKADPVVKAIRTAAHTGEVGDGKIIITNIEQIISIRTGEINESAI